MEKKGTYIRMPFVGKFSFTLLSESGAPWIFLAIAICFTLAYSLREVGRKHLLLGISVVVGLLCGYIEQIGDFLVLSRVLVVMPFSVNGWLCGIEKVDRTTDNKWTKVMGVSILAVALFVFVLLAKKFYFCDLFLRDKTPIQSWANDIYTVRWIDCFGILSALFYWFRFLLLYQGGA